MLSIFVLFAVLFASSYGNRCTTKRCRQPWSKDNPNAALYISGFKKLADTGVMQAMAETHSKLFSDRIHWTSIFLPWHRAFLYDLENKIRALGTEYKDFALPYWDWSAEPTPTEVKKDPKLGPLILNSGLGTDSEGKCLKDSSPFAEGKYKPKSGSCLIRDVRYSKERNSCLFTSAPEVMDLIDSYTSHRDFTNQLENTPHYNPHVCLGGNVGQMADTFSPDDPIFYIHHCFVDYIWALWQDCNDYDKIATAKKTKSKSKAYAGNVNEKLPLPHNKANVFQYSVKDMLNMASLNVIYDKGSFWGNAKVDDEDNCGVGLGKDNINNDWFYDGSSGSSRRRLMLGSQTKSLEIYDKLKKSPKYKADRKKLVHSWAIRVCKWEQTVAGMRCDIPADFDDCSDMPIDATTKDIKITKKELLAKRGLTACMKKTREEYYHFAARSHSLHRLCAGCFDPFCDRRRLKAKCDKIGLEKTGRATPALVASAGKKKSVKKGSVKKPALKRAKSDPTHKKSKKVSRKKKRKKRKSTAHVGLYDVDMASDYGYSDDDRFTYSMFWLLSILVISIAGCLICFGCGMVMGYWLVFASKYMSFSAVQL